MSVDIRIENVAKRFGDLTIIPDLSLDVKNGEFFTLLGPSGCGKTTLLRMIAGFNSIESGNIYFSGKRINDIPAHLRNIGMVFQNYAIFPHLTVRQNVEYGLHQRKVSASEMKPRVDEIMEAMRITQYGERLPQNLSGGQQQRVALARALVIKPDILLMDEPLSNLDAKLRVEMRNFIRRIQKQFSITTIYVTHDQEEALAVSDRLAVMNLGEISHIGAPQEVYLRPKNIFTACFIGHSNLFHAKMQGGRLVFADGTAVGLPGVKASEGQEVIVGIRPEEFVLSDTGLKATVESTTFLGSFVHYELSFAKGMVKNGQVAPIFIQEASLDKIFFKQGDTVTLSPKIHKINVYDLDEQSLI